MGNLKININEYEIFVNGKFVAKANGSREFEKVSNGIFQEYREKGYRTIETLTGIYTIMSNADKGDAVFIAYRKWFGFRDNSGQKIYDGDRLKSNVNGRLTINQHWEDYREGEYYYRIHPYNCNRYYDTEIEDMNFINELEIEVDKKIFNF